VPPPPLRVIHESFADDAALDTGVSRALLLRASDGEVPETFRLHLPGRVVAFGKRDVIAPGYAGAVAAARSAGYAAIERLAGGRAALFHEGTLAFSWTIPDVAPRDGITKRFETISGLMQSAFRHLGVDAGIGEIPGEYCPGAYSVHAEGRIKIMGVGQRLARRAAHIGGVVVVSGSAAAREVLVPVYAALGLDWDPDTVGALQDVHPEVTVEDTGNAILSELAALRPLESGTLEPATLARARELAPEHVPD
jgi:lipoate-protein ligase A